MTSVVEWKAKHHRAKLPGVFMGRLPLTAKIPSFGKFRTAIQCSLNSIRVLHDTMSTPQLPNYLRAHRKRLGLTQDEVAHLLGTEGAAKMCRYEKFARTPSLETALACEVIFKRPARELFAGLYQKVERQVAARAVTLLRRKEKQEKGQPQSRMRQRLQDLTIASSKTKTKD